MSGNAPTVLYKYMRPARADDLRSGLLKFSRKVDLNDPFEFHVGKPSEAFVGAVGQARDEVVAEFAQQLSTARGIREVIGDDPRVQPLNRRARRRMARDANSPIREAIVEAQITDPKTVASEFTRDTLESATDIVVFCCSESRDSVPMWAHYTENHAGFQIGFKPELLFRSVGDKEGMQLWQVEYRSTPPTLEISERPLFSFLAIKNEDWRYEREWRFIARKSWSDAASSSRLSLFKLNPEAISEVTLGCLATSQTKKTVLAAAAEGGVNCPIYEAHPSNDGFEFARARVA